MYLCYILFGIGLLSYFMAAINYNSASGETFSDVANGLVLITAALLLFRIARKQERSKDGEKDKD